MERTNDCPGCGRPLRRMHNPYMGAGLAVHEYVDVCDRCGTVVYVPTESVPAQPVRRVSRWRLALRRLRGGRR